MLPFRPSKPLLRTMGQLLVGCALLSACSLGDIIKGTKTDYALQGTDSDAATAEYLQSILDERVSEKAKTLASEKEEPDLRARQENYIEQTVRADLLKALHAKGYYAGAVTFADGAAPLSGSYAITYGPQYRIGSLAVIPESHFGAMPANAPGIGDVLDAETVLSAQRALRDSIGKDHCYFNLSVDNRVRLDRTRATAALDYLVDAGRQGNFGTLSFDGNGSVKESYLRRLVPWREGDCFRREKLEAYKTALMQSGLFAQAEIVLPEDGPDADNTVPVTLALKERAQRTISAGLTYYSDEGPGGVLSWEHRNFLGAAEKFKAELNLSMIKQSLSADFNKPFFIRKDQNLSLNAELRRQDTDAFEEFGINTGGAISRKFGHYTTASTGLELSLLRIDDQTLNTTETYGLLSAPQSLSYDTRDNSLDPTKGVNLNLTAEPFFDVLGQADPFVKTQFTGSTYLAIGAQASTVLAAKGSIGSIWGAEVDAVPATERFYAGGGGSVRGYGYQEVGPQRNGDPTGGLSIATMSLELRTKFTEKFGSVAFVDSGSVSEESTPDFSNMAVGAGVGVRYYTSFGPIRFDVATPLTQKDDLDQNYQFYISIGQAF